MKRCYKLAANTINYRYTKTEMEKLLKSLTVLIDTREKKNEHIKKYLSGQGINYKSKKLDFGDYSLMLPENTELGIMRDIYFNNDGIAIERKSSLEELSGNMTKERARFENELIRGSNSKMILLIEEGAGWQKIINGYYDTQYKPQAFLAGLLTYKNRYDLRVEFISRELTGALIRYELHYYLREFLK